MLTRRSLSRLMALAPIAAALPAIATEPKPYFVIVRNVDAQPELYLHGAARMMWAKDPGDGEPYSTEDDAMRGAQFHDLLRPAGEDEGGPGYAVLVTGIEIRRITT